MYSLVVGDLHGGNSYADILSFLQLLKRVAVYRDLIREIIFVGDTIDGLDKYETQKYKQYPETLTLQRNFIKWIIELLENEFPKGKIILVLGNHEKDFRGILYDKDSLEKIYSNIEICTNYVDHNDFLYIHQLGKGSRFGSQSGWTSNAVDRALSIIIHYERKLYKKLKGIITGHVHKVFDHVYINGYDLILMPAFLKTGHETSEDTMYSPTIILTTTLGGTTNILLFSKEYNDLDTILSYNDIFISIIRKNYKKITNIDTALKILDLI